MARLRLEMEVFEASVERFRLYIFIAVASCEGVARSTARDHDYFRP
jgi:hypothetical protein